MLALLPLLLSGLAFTLLFVAVPNCHVPFRHALMGGAICALLFEGAKQAFAMFVALSPSYQLIYGAFAAVPLFLVWIYICWLIVLLGAEFVRALSGYDVNRRGVDAPPFFWCLKLLEQLWQAQKTGHGLHPSQLVRQLPGLSAVLLSSYLDDLKRANIIASNGRGQYLLCRDLHSLSLEQFHQMIDRPLPNSLGRAEHDPHTVWSVRLAQYLRAIQEYRSERLQLSLARLFSEPPPADSPDVDQRGDE